MPQTIYTHTFENGLTLLAEEIAGLESAAFTLLTPAGGRYDSDAQSGLATLTCEMMLRGCGSRDSRAFVTDLDNLGVERGESVGGSHISFSGATLAKNLFPALSIYADVVRRPQLPADQLEAGRMVVVQELQSIEDDPAHKVMIELRRRYYPTPWGRPSTGEMAALQSLKLADVQTHFSTYVRPNGAILAIAGRIDWPAVKDQIGKLFGDWKKQDVPEPKTGPRGPTRDHIEHESQQTQIAVAYASVPYSDPKYFQAWGSVGALSGGMSARLFTEVREKRGLCYSVYASHHTLLDRAAVLCYAGTSAERAQETLDVLIGELVRLAKGIEPQELDRLKARVKSGLIMQQESSSARSGSMAREYYLLGRVRTLDEIGALVDALSTESINGYLAANPPRDFTVVTVGSQALEVPRAVS